jgi:hypothetical protein
VTQINDPGCSGVIHLQGGYIMLRKEGLINSLKDESTKRLVFPTSLMSEQVNLK